MGKTIMEKLVNIYNYQFDLCYEIPVDFSMNVHPRITAEVIEKKQLLRPEGLLISGTIVGKIHLSPYDIVSVEGKKQQSKISEHTYFFTYLIPDEELKERNLLNYEFEVQIEKINYYFIKKKGQVFLIQQLHMILDLAHYSLENLNMDLLGGMQKKSGVFLKKSKDIEESFLKISPLDLPPDFSSIINISGRVDNFEIDLIQDGCLVDVIGKFHCEYITEDKRIGIFFFEKEEHFFFPMIDLDPKVIVKHDIQIDLKDISLERDNNLLILYHCQINFFQKQETVYFTGNQPTNNVCKTIQIEQISQPVVKSQMLKEEVNLKNIPIAQILELTGEFTETLLEKVSDQLLISGFVNYVCSYLDLDGVERIYEGQCKVEEMVNLPNYPQQFSENWSLETRVEVPTWELVDAVLLMKLIIDYEVCSYKKSFELVVIDFPQRLVKRERFYLTEEINRGRCLFHDSEKIYLNRYAESILRIESKIIDWQTRRLDMGWLVKGSGELVIYYLNEDGEFHQSKDFSFYHYLQLENELGIEVQVTPELHILDNSLLQDGSLVRIEYLIRQNYQILKKAEEWLVVEMGCELNSKQKIRPILKMDSINKRFDKVLSLGSEEFSENGLSEILELKMTFGDYDLDYRDQILFFTGELEIEIRYTNQRGKLRTDRLPIPMEVKERIEIEDDMLPNGDLRAFPVIKNYEYTINSGSGHPLQTENYIYLCVDLEINYRMVGKFVLR